MTIHTRFASIVLSTLLVATACGAGSADTQATGVDLRTDAEADTDESKQPDDEAAADASVAEDVEADPDAIVDGDMCAAVKRLIGEIGAFTGLSFADPDAMRTSMGGLLEEMEAVVAAAPTPGLEASATELLTSWRPWHDAMSAVDFDFFALDPATFDALIVEGQGPEAFTANSDTIFDYAITSCGVPERAIDAVTATGTVGATIDDEGDASLVDTGVQLDIALDGEALVMTDGFCGIGVDGLLVGSWSLDGTTVSVLYDTSGAADGVRTISVESPGGASGAQIEVEYGDGRGIFRSSRYSGSFTCE